MPDRQVAEIRVSGSPLVVAELADAIAKLDGWTLIGKSHAYVNKRDPGERRYLTLRQGYPPVSAIKSWLAANGWQTQGEGPAGTLWVKTADVGRVGVPHDDSDQEMTMGAVERIAAAEGLDLGELVALIDVQATTRKEGTDGAEH